jgi:hypothetical protein
MSAGVSDSWNKWDWVAPRVTVVQTLGMQAPSPQPLTRKDYVRIVVAALLLLASITVAVRLFVDRPETPLGLLVRISLYAVSFAAGAVAIPPVLRTKLVLFVVIAAGAAGLLATLLAVVPTLPPPSPPSEPPSPSGGPSKTEPPTEEPFDDFSGDLNLNKWTLTRLQGSDEKQVPHQIYTKVGRLNLEVSPANSAHGVNVELRAKLPADRSIRKISMKMALVSQKGGSDGAAYLIVSSARGRENRLWMGPNGDNEPTLGYYICENEKSLCHRRKESITDQQYPLEKGREFLVEVVADPDGDLHFDVIDHSSALAPGGGPIKNFRLYLFSDADRSFHVTVDDVKIAYS